MTALQVREFPDDLYKRLRKYAVSQHRSMAQQVVVAVEQMLARGEGTSADVPQLWGGATLQQLPQSYVSDLDTEAARAERIKRREELLRQAEEESESLPDNLPSAVEVLRQAREERDVALEGVVPEALEKAV